MEESQKKALDDFLAANPDLERLSARLATFNIFRALKIEDAEIRHSNTLGWLLDPAESHGLGDVFLRRILSNMLLQDHSIDGLSAAKVELMDFRGVEVRREWQHIDVLVIDRENKLVLLIENKVWCGEGVGQLARYRSIVQREFPGFRLIPVFLTLEGQPADDEEASDYISYSHAKLCEVLNQNVAQRRHQMTEPVATFLAHYIDTLRKLTMQDDDLITLCQDIYRKHKDAIKLIVEYGEISCFSRVASEVLEANDCEILNARPTVVWFMPRSWAKIVPENGTQWPGLKRQVSVVCWIEVFRNKVHLHFEICRMTDPKLRMKLVSRLHEAGFKLGSKAFTEDAIYSRFYSPSRIAVTDPGDENEMEDAVAKLVAKAKEQFPKAEAVLREVFGAN